MFVLIYFFNYKSENNCLRTKRKLNTSSVNTSFILCTTKLFYHSQKTKLIELFILINKTKLKFVTIKKLVYIYEYFKFKVIRCPNYK